jgi:hypothetical protein
VLIALSSRQETVVSDRLMHAKIRKGTRHWEGETKARKPLDASYAVETARWVADVRDDFLRVLRPVLMREAKRVRKDMIDNGLPAESIVLEKTVQGVLTDVLGIADRSVQNMSQRIADAIHTMDAEGASIEDIQKHVKATIGTRSGWRKQLTTNVTTAAYEAIKHEVYAQGGNKVSKTWNTEDDERVRESHRWLDGVTTKATALFHMHDTMMRFPCDPHGPVEEVANCRCWLTYSIR